VRIDAGEVGLHHRIGRDPHEVRFHAPRREQRLDLAADLVGGDLHQSVLMFAALMISAHCADSARIAAPNSSGVLPTTSAPCSATFLWNSLSFSTWLASA